MYSHNVFDAEATPLRARALVRARLLTARQLDAARDLVSGPQDVPLVVRELLSLVGVTLLACAVVFFVAANWSSLPPFARMGLVATALVACAGIAMHLGIRPTSPGARGGHAAATLAGLLIGPLLMIYGQTYQTGADAWSLFFGWTVLLVPFIVATRLLGLFLVALLLVHVTVPLFVVQQLGFAEDGHGALTAGTVLVGVDAAALAVLVLLQRRFRVAHRTGPRAVALLGALVALATGTVAVTITNTDAHGALRAAAMAFAIGFGVCLLSMASLRRRADLYFTALGAFLLGGLGLVFAGEMMFRHLGVGVGTMFLLGALVLAVVGVLTRMLLHLHRQGAHAAEEEP